ncbi:alpha/beta hydrolase [Streptomyces sp. NPDC045251]|uniref:alpha/beta fold hydrolase n=1 Tax=unclassified Streptomyces TaxID=2593676 RepID=UPI0033F69F78
MAGRRRRRSSSRTGPAPSSPSWSRVPPLGQRSWTRSGSDREWSTREAFGSYVKDWVTADLTQQIIGRPVPVKVIVGEHDLALTAEAMHATWLTHYPNAELEEIANSGHYPMYETPVALAATLETFLRT